MIILIELTMNLMFMDCGLEIVCAEKWILEQ